MNYSRSIFCVELISMIILTLLCFLSSLNKFCDRMTCYYQTVRRCSFVSSAKNKNKSNDCFLFTDQLVQLKNILQICLALILRYISERCLLSFQNRCCFELYLLERAPSCVMLEATGVSGKPRSRCMQTHVS